MVKSKQDKQLKRLMFAIKLSSDSDLIILSAYAYKEVEKRHLKDNVMQIVNNMENW